MSNEPELTDDQKKINADRAAKGWDPYQILICEDCGKQSEFRTKDEIACSRWDVYFRIKCPDHAIKAG